MLDAEGRGAEAAAELLLSGESKRCIILLLALYFPSVTAALPFILISISVCARARLR